MAIRTGKSRLTIQILTTVAAGAAAVALLPAPAQAIGNNRDVHRGCGTNHVSSGRYSSTYAWAQTTKVDGDCSGRLSVGLRASDGYTYPRVYGSSTSAYTSRTDSAGFGSGMHWGCDGCSVTYS
jgi:hypothetical protein